MRHGDEAFVPVVHGAVEVVIHPLPTDQPGLVGVYVLPGLLRGDERRAGPLGPPDQIVGTGEGIEGAARFIQPEVQHDVQVPHPEDLRVAGDPRRI